MSQKPMFHINFSPKYCHHAVKVMLIQTSETSGDSFPFIKFRCSILHLNLLFPFKKTWRSLNLRLLIINGKKREKMPTNYYKPINTTKSLMRKKVSILKFWLFLLSTMKANNTLESFNCLLVRIALSVLQWRSFLWFEFLGCRQ